MSATAPDLNRLRIDRGGQMNTAPSRGAGVGMWLLVVVSLAIGAAGAVPLIQKSRSVPVTVGSVRVVGGKAAATSGLVASGYVVARLVAQVSPAAAGRVARVFVDEGARVDKGALLAVLERGELDAQLQAAIANLREVEAQLPALQRDLDRAEALAGSGAGTGLERDRARDQIDLLVARKAAAEAQVRVVETSITNTEVRAPFAGTVLRKRTEVGEFVSPGAGVGATAGAAGGVVQLADLSSLEVEVDVNELYIAKVSPDQPALIALDALPGETFPGHVRTIVPTADRQKATVRVRVAFESVDARVLPEMGARVEFVDEKALAAAAAPVPPKEVLVDSAALVGTGERRGVFVIEEGVARRREVRVGEAKDTGTVVLDGLTGAESIVLRPPADLKDGAAVSPKENPAP